MVEMLEQVQVDDEPIGIIISRGSREEAPSRFTAYVWGPVPGEVELAEVSDEHRAA
jgi:hypothetical protein